MESLKTGQFFGQTNVTIRSNGVTLTDTEYTHEKVDWHYHENAYFTFILEGKVIEGNKKETYHCAAGSLLFHHWHESHYNIKPKGFTRGFHVELDPQWFQQYGMESVYGSIKINDPRVKIQMYNIVKETKLDPQASGPAIDSLLLAMMDEMVGNNDTFNRKIPVWAKQLCEMLNDVPAENYTLTSLATALNIHPVHLSRGFPRYFHCNLGDYMRTVKIHKALSLLTDKRKSLTDIALECGFADQSHFIRAFKTITRTNPLQYRNLLIK